MVDASVREHATLLPSPKRRTMSAVCEAFPRNEFFTLLYFLGCANGLIGRIIQSFQFSDWEGALATADINAIMLLACFAGISLVSAKSPEHLYPMRLVRRAHIPDVGQSSDIPVELGGGDCIKFVHLGVCERQSRTGARRLDPARNDRSHAVEPIAVPDFRQAYPQYRCRTGVFASWHPPHGKYGRFPGRIWLHDCIAGLLLACEHVAGAVVLGYHYAMGWAPLDRQGRDSGPGSPARP